VGPVDAVNVVKYQLLCLSLILPFHGSTLGIIQIILGGSGPALTTHGSLDLKKEIQFQILSRKIHSVRIE
jgi:hypothetical protein